MHKIGAGLVVLAAFLLANLVAAGVYLVLWQPLEHLDETYHLVLLMLIGAVAVSCAVFFLKGFLSVVSRWLQSRSR